MLNNFAARIFDSYLVTYSTCAHLAFGIFRFPGINWYGAGKLCHHKFLLKASGANNSKARFITYDISKVGADMDLNKRDLSAAQQTESQTKLHAETIEYEVRWRGTNMRMQ